MQKDLIMFAATDYNWKQLSYLINSIKQTSFTGDICAVIFNATFDTVDKLIEKGIYVVGCEKDDENRMYRHTSNMPIHTERFFHFFNILKDNSFQYRYVITVDAKDVIFQQNPSDWLETALKDKKIVVASEGLKYKDEPWGNENLEKTYGPWFHDYFKHSLIMNVGVIAGEATYIRDLCLQLFLSCINRPIPICDQAVFNVLMMTLPWNDITKYASLSDGWAAHLGTFSDPMKFKEFGPLLVEKPPKFNMTNGVVVKTSEGVPLILVHQWDRCPQIRSAIETLYGDKEERKYPPNPVFGAMNPNLLPALVGDR
ncbi:MAG TPA: hypothetical protein VK553_11380 [Candidatus Nitrosopolaris rasttigaisensis]|nr:hypothetical protein [Candidatus Nitrosopolaris rasttigaisensis]